MAEFSATDAALEGFRITRERPRDVAVWAGFIFICSLAATVLAILLAGESINTFRTLQENRGETDPTEILNRLAPLAPVGLLLGPLALLYSAMLSCAVFRAVLRPGEGGPGLLRLGGDELRVALATLVLFLLAVGVGIGLSIALIALIAAGAAAGGGLAVLISIVAVIATFCAVIWITVRLSMALPMTFYEKRVRVFESWRLTKGRFWPLFGMYLLSTVLVILISLLGTVILFPLAALAGGGLSGAAEAMQADYSSLGAWFGPVTLLSLIFSSVLSAVTNAVQVAPAAEAYRELGGVRGADAAEVFS